MTTDDTLVRSLHDTGLSAAAWADRHLQRTRMSVRRGPGTSASTGRTACAQ